MTSPSDIVPDGCVELGTLTIVAFMAPDGRVEYGWEDEGTLSPAEVIGMLEMVKASYIDGFYAMNEDYPDDPPEPV